MLRNKEWFPLVQRSIRDQRLVKTIQVTLLDGIMLYGTSVECQVLIEQAAGEFLKKPAKNGIFLSLLFYSQALRLLDGIQITIAQ